MLLISSSQLSWPVSRRGLDCLSFSHAAHASFQLGKQSYCNYLAAPYLVQHDA